MSQSDTGEVNRREVAYRLFAAEFEDADYSYAESDEERAPNYVVTPTGARVNRVFVVGVLTEVEQVSDEVVRARVVDPTGAFVVYAGQYQPEALAALESTSTPSFVAVTGKARTFQPEDSDIVYTSIRPEEVSEVDAETRDRWVVTTAEQTVDRVATMAAAHERVERGDNLRRVLEDAGVQSGLAAGIPLALDHYGTTPAYLEAVRNLALRAARVVAGEVDAAGDLSLSPSDGGDASLDFAADLDVAAVEASDDDDESGPELDDESTTGEPATSEPATSEPATSEPGTDEPAADASPAAETPDSGDAASEAAPEETDDTSGGEDDSTGDGEMYELSEEEREEVKDNYDVEFSSGTDIPDTEESEAESAAAETEPAESETETVEAETETVEADTDTAEPSEEPEAEDTDETADAVEADDAEAIDETVDEDAAEELGDFDADDEAFDESQEEADTTAEFTEDEYDEPASDAEDAEAGELDGDLEDYVVDLMDELDDGDGALRENVVATAADDLDADEGDVEDAIQDALMSGRCYESGDDHLKAI